MVRILGKKEFCLCYCSSDYVEGFTTFKPDNSSSGDVDVAGGHFKTPTDEATLAGLGTKTFAQNTEKKMLWAATLYRKWWYRRCQQEACPYAISVLNIENGSKLVKVHFQTALCCFVNEVWRKDEKEFLGETLKQIVIMIQLYLEKQGVQMKLIDDPDMAKFRNTLDNVMKRQAADGLSHKESSLSIDLADENLLWEKGILGNSEPDQLRDSLLLVGNQFRSPGWRGTQELVRTRV